MSTAASSKDCEVVSQWIPRRGKVGEECDAVIVAAVLIALGSMFGCYCDDIVATRVHEEANVNRRGKSGADVARWWSGEEDVYVVCVVDELSSARHSGFICFSGIHRHNGGCYGGRRG